MVVSQWGNEYSKVGKPGLHKLDPNYLDLAEKELARAKRYKRSVSIILFDVESARIKIPDGSSITTTISIGVAEWTGEEEFTKLLARSDKMLYAAKNSGRNCVVWEI